MKRRALSGSAGVAALISVVALHVTPVLADDDRGLRNESCRSLIVGAYLTTIEDGAGEFASRSVITFHHDGTVAVVDASQSSGVTGTSFSSQQGSYRCTSRTGAVATTIDFGFPDNINIGRFDWIVTITPERSIEGEFTLNLLTPLATCNPFEAEDTCTLEIQNHFTFTSVRIPAQAD